jgi:hypothetical protein
MEMAGKQFSPFMEMVVQLCLTDCAIVSYGLWKWLASSSPIYGNGCATASYGLCNCVLRFVQLRLTVYGNGWQAVLPVYGNGCAIMSYGLCNCVLRLVQLRLTVYGNGWQAVLPFMETVLEVVRAKISGCIKS